MMRKQCSSRILIIVIIFTLLSCEKDKKTEPGSGIIQGKPSETICCNDVRDIFIDPNGVKWFATGNGLSVFDDDSWTSFSIDDELPSSQINSLGAYFEGDTMHLLIGTIDGLVDYSVIKNKILGSQIKDTVSASSLLSNSIKHICRDSDNFTWFGSSKGVSANLDDIWLEYDVNFLLERDTVKSMAVSASGIGFVGTSNGVYLLDKQVDAISGATNYTTPWAGLPSNNILSVCLLPDGSQWFGTDKGAAFHNQIETKKGWTTFTTSDGLIGDFIQSLQVDNDGNVWFGTKNGVSVFTTDSTWVNYTLHDGLISNNVRDIAFDIDGSVWFATDKGLSKFNHSNWYNYSAL